MIAFIDDRRAAHGVEPTRRVLPTPRAPTRVHAAERAGPSKLPAWASRESALQAGTRRIWEASFQVCGIREAWRQLQREAVAAPRCQAGRLMKHTGLAGAVRGRRFDDKVISPHARGTGTRGIQGHLEELHGVEVSPQLISTVTDAVTAEVAEWRSRPLDPVYPLVFFDALRVKVRDEGVVRNKAVCLALGVSADGRKDVLGLWVEQTEGAKFWLRIVNELRNRGVNDILTAVVDGLKGLPEAVNAAFPRTQVQTCIVHLLRNSLSFVAWQGRREVVAALKPIYQAPTAEAALTALGDFGSGVRVWLATGVTGMRGGVNGLALQVQQALSRDPHAGDLYVFRGRRGDLLKILWHDGLGMSLYAKRLERGRFIWPTPADGAVSSTAAHASTLVGLHLVAYVCLMLKRAALLAACS